MTPTDEDVERPTKQNAMLMRALMRAKAERDALLKQLAALRPDTQANDAGAAR
jgi:hypothetical protein